MISAFDHDLLKPSGDQIRGTFHALHIQNSVLRPVDQKGIEIRLLRRIRRKQNDAGKITLMLRGILSSHRSAERVPSDIIPIVVGMIHDLPGLVDSQEGEVQRHFYKIYIHLLFRQPVEERSICRLIHLCTRIKNEHFLIRRSVKEPPGIRLLNSHDRIGLHGIGGRSICRIIYGSVEKESEHSRIDKRKDRYEDLKSQLSCFVMEKKHPKESADSAKDREEEQCSFRDAPFVLQRSLLIRSK